MQAAATHKSLKIVLVTAAALFFLTRFIILSSAIDHIHGIDHAEYQIMKLAKALEEGQNASAPRNHLWGHKATALALLPFLKMGVSPTISMKLLRVLISFVGYFSLVFLISWRLGPKYGAILAALLLFPSIDYLKWSLVLWGSYPEASDLIWLVVLLWVVALKKEKYCLFTTAGLANGLLLAYCPSVAMIAILPPILTCFFVAPGRRLRSVAYYGLGVFIGISPFIFFAVKAWRELTFAPEVIQSDKGALIVKSLGLPSPVRFFHNFNMKLVELFQFVYELPIILFAAGWVLFSVIFKRFRQEKWRIIFPLSIFSGFVFLSSFRYLNLVSIRHMTWLPPVGYFCLAAAVGDEIFIDSVVKSGKIRRLVTGLKISLFLLLVFFHVKANLPFYQLSDMGVIRHYRGQEYYEKQIGSLIGEEVQAMNCLMDRLPSLIEEPDFQRGVKSVFPFGGTYECCAWNPLPLNTRLWSDVECAGSKIEFWRGIGCAIRMKNAPLGSLDNLAPCAGSEPKAAILEGYRQCDELTCMSPRFK